MLINAINVIKYCSIWARLFLTHTSPSPVQRDTSRQAAFLTLRFISGDLLPKCGWLYSQTVAHFLNSFLSLSFLCVCFTNSVFLLRYHFIVYAALPLCQTVKDTKKKDMKSTRLEARNTQIVLVPITRPRCTRATRRGLISTDYHYLTVVKCLNYAMCHSYSVFFFLKMMKEQGVCIRWGWGLELPFMTSGGVH